MTKSGKSKKGGGRQEGKGVKNRRSSVPLDNIIQGKELKELKKLEKLKPLPLPPHC